MTGPRRSLRPRISTALRLSGLLALLLAVVLSLTAWQTIRIFDRRAAALTATSLNGEVNEFAAALRRGGGAPFADVAVRYLSTSVLPAGETLLISARGGRPVGSVGSARFLADHQLRVALAAPPASVMTVTRTVAGVPVTYLVAPIVSAKGPIGTFVVVVNRTTTLAENRTVTALVLGQAAIALAAAVVGSYVVLRRLLRTVGAMTKTAGEMGAGTPGQRLGDPGTNDELAQLASTFDAMLERLDSVLEQQRRLLSDVSHQLRTPLTVVRGHLEVLDRFSSDDPTEVHETISLVTRELDEMRSMTERLLLLGHALEPDFLERAPIDIRSFLADCQAATTVVATRNWSLGPIPDVEVIGDQAKLRGAMFNLIDNAAKATADGDRIEISAELVDPGTVALLVDDEGPGIPTEQISTVLSRFGRPDTSDRPGTGLGLAIVSAVAAAHGGTFALGPSPLGGCRATLTLPVTQNRGTT